MLQLAATAHTEMRTECLDPISARGLDTDKRAAIPVPLDLHHFSRQSQRHEHALPVAFGNTIAATAQGSNCGCLAHAPA
ncbi:hypothetical protein GCM10007989_19040 [Devosia pacifica]|uniref:Uncharacterized protein n=1 Tax=Devosia pacifica TaxID=1335967 RepID=A0A918S482_9HYPH|nr:hypothetical protein GCM10007989_19040 [Devosia pacifica]